MSKFSDPTYLRTDQYRNATNLNARIGLHERFSTNSYAWHQWLFDQLKLPAKSRILELGCGPGTLWQKNGDRIPDGWQMTLSDLSLGMVQEAQRNLANMAHSFQFVEVDARFIPLEAERFDAVLANHMLYHVPQRSKALAEIRRVLKPGGRFYASTVGQRHMGELKDLVHEFDPGLARAEQVAVAGSNEFTLENGLAQIISWFPNATVHNYDDALIITEAQPLVDYMLSSITYAEARSSSERIQQFTDFVQRKIAAQGAIHVTKSSGVFEFV